MDSFCIAFLIILILLTPGERSAHPGPPANALTGSEAPLPRCGAACHGSPGAPSSATTGLHRSDPSYWYTAPRAVRPPHAAPQEKLASAAPPRASAREALPASADPPLADPPLAKSPASVNATSTQHPTHAPASRAGSHGRLSSPQLTAP